LDNKKKEDYSLQDNIFNFGRLKKNRDEKQMAQALLKRWRAVLIINATVRWLKKTVGKKWKK